MAFSDYQITLHGPQTVISWPDTNTPQMEINRALLRNDFLPTAPQAPPNTGSTELFPDLPYQLIKSLDHPTLTTGYLIVVPHATIHPFSATFETLKPAAYLFPLQMEPPRSQLSKEPLTVISPLMKDRDLSLA
jgi:hypothetical protein